MPLNLLLDDNQPAKKELRYGTILADQSRASIAYDPMGVLANTGVIRKWNPGLKGGELNIGGTIVTDMVFVEESSSNLLTDALYNDFTLWANEASTTCVGNAITAPDGTATADKIIEDTSTGSHHRAKWSTIPVTSGQSYAYSVYLKAGARTKVRLLLTDTTNIALSAFDLSNGTIISSITGTAIIQKVSNGFYRCSIIGTANSTMAAAVYITPLDASGNTSYTGDGVSELYAWKACVENKPFATTHIDGGVTRAADSVSLTFPRPLKKEFTIVGAFAPNWAGDTKGKSGNAYEVFMTLLSGGNYYYYIVRNDPADAGKNEFTFRSYNGVWGGPSLPNVIANTTLLRLYYFVISYKNGVGRLWLLPNNGSLSKAELSTGLVIGITRFFPGCHSVAGYESNAYNLPPKIIENWACTNDTQATALMDGLKQELVVNGDFSQGTAKTATNIITNGNFANGTTGWTSAGGAILTAINNTLTITGDGTGAIPAVIPTSNISIVNGRKYYGRSKIRVTNANCSSMKQRLIAGYLDIVVSNPVLNQWYTVSGVATAGSSATVAPTALSHTYADNATANGKVMEVQEVLVIDLTAIFGVGNEPSKAQCDLIFGTWFDTTTTVEDDWTGWTLHANASVSNGELVLNASSPWEATISANYIQVLPNNVYQLTAMGLSADGVGRAYAQLRGFDINQNMVYDQLTASGSTYTTSAAYTSIAGQYTIPEGVYYVKVKFQSNIAGTFKFDNASLKLK